ncbi:MAG TPA: chorismate-binding protein, partial [Steroidobacteraceae bacterium]
MKLASFSPRFLLESVEGGERLARYSFVGFGDAFEVRLDGSGLSSGGVHYPAPGSGGELLDALRAALRQAPKPQPEISGVPLAGGLVGYAAYDIVRYFERLPARKLPSGVPALHYVAPRSILVFDHLTRGIALVHAGPEEERRALRREVIRALRGGLPMTVRPGRHTAPAAEYARADYLQGVKRAQEYIAAGDVYQLVLASRFSGRHDLDPFQAYRALRLINPSPYMYYCILGDVAVVG